MIDEKSFKRLNHAVRSEGEHNSRLMFKFPTASEAKLRKELDERGVKYSFQKLLYRMVEGSRKLADAYYIANFWFPKKRLIINIRKGKRKIEVASEGLRTFEYGGIFPKAQVISLTEEDIDNPEFIEGIIGMLR